MKSVNVVIGWLLIFWEDHYPWTPVLTGIFLILPTLILGQPLISGETGYEQRQILSHQEDIEAVVAIPDSIIVGKRYVARLHVKIVSPTVSVSSTSMIAASPIHTPVLSVTATTPVTSSSSSLPSTIPISATLCLNSPLLGNPNGEDCLTRSKEVGVSSTPLILDLEFEALGLTEDVVKLWVMLEFPGDSLSENIDLRVNRLSMVVRLIVSGLSGIPGLLAIAVASLKLVQSRRQGKPE